MAPLQGDAEKEPASQMPEWVTRNFEMERTTFVAFAKEGELII